MERGGASPGIGDSPVCGDDLKMAVEGLGAVVLYDGPATNNAPLRQSVDGFTRLYVQGSFPALGVLTPAMAKSGGTMLMVYQNADYTVGTGTSRRQITVVGDATGKSIKTTEGKPFITLVIGYR